MAHNNQYPVEYQNEQPLIAENQNYQPQEIENHNDDIIAGEQNDNNDADEVIPEEEQLVDGRRVLALVRDTFVSSDRVARVILKTFKSRIDPVGSSWKNVASLTKFYYFEEFRKAYHWEDDMEARVKKAWNRKASKCYYDMLIKAKRKDECAYTAKLEKEVRELRQMVSDLNRQLEETRQEIEDRARGLVGEMTSNMSQTSSSADGSNPPEP